MDGGPNYLQQFAFPLAADRFPIGVWLECAVDPQAVATDHGAGLDIYTALCANQAELANARNGGMRVLFQAEWLGRMPTDAVNAGYMVGDEWDMTRGPTACLNGDWQDQINRFPDDGRVKYANFGKGVNFWETNAEAACWVNSVDLPSTDEYWFSDNNVCGSSEGGGKPGVITANNCHVAANYGWNVQRVRNLVSPSGSKATWSFVEDGCPFGDSGWPCIQTQQIRPAVWHSLIAGAQGIVYFNHSFKAGAGNGACAGSFHTLRDCVPVRVAVTAVNAEIQSLAGVLRSPSLASGFSANANVRARAKWNGSNFYVLAGTAGHVGPVTGLFGIPCVGNATATVVGESRSVPVIAGAFSDTFANPNAVHIYRVDGGSSCGLE